MRLTTHALAGLDRESADAVVQSDADEQLLIYIPFREVRVPRPAADCGLPPQVTATCLLRRL